ncbi:MAG: GntR family transcriptional regulator [Victivallales bacterium]|nr:GntR family transcriptional regulator [Victivallales bacterium]
MDEPVGFKSNQVAEVLRKKILSGEYPYHSKLPTCRELARLHGVSYVTMHKALTWLEKSGYITMREHVGTTVSFIQNASTPTCRVVNLVTNDSLHPATQIFLEQGQEMFAGHGWEIRQFRLNEYDKNLPDTALQAVISPDAYSIFFDVRTAFQNTLASQKHFYERTIYIGEYLPDPRLTCIICDGASEISKLLEHFQARGRTNTAIYCYGMANNLAANQRISYWRSNMMGAGKSFQWCSEHIFFCEASQDYEDRQWMYDSFEELLKNDRLSDIDSLYIPLERHAVLFEELCAEHGINIPGDLAIACLGNDPCLENAPIPLTYLDNRILHHLKLAMDILETRLRGEELPQRFFTFSPQLVIRASSGG